MPSPRLPDGVDPAELARTDPEALRASIANAMPFLGFRLERVLLAANLATPEGRARAAEQAIAVVREHPSALVQDQYLMRIADACRVDVVRLRQMMAGPAPAKVPVPRRPPERVDEQARPRRRPIRIVDNTDSRVLLLCLHRPETVPDYVSPPMFADPGLRALFAELLDHPSDDLPGLIESLAPELGDALGQLAVMDEPNAEPDRIIGQFLHDAAVRKVAAIRSEAQRTGDTALMPLISDLQSLIPQVRAANFDLAVAVGLVPLLSTWGST